VLSELPAEAALLVSQQAFIPGCIMMLADIAMPQEGGAGLGDFEAGAWELQQQDAQVEYQPAYANGFWRAQVNSGSAKSPSLFLAYDSLSDYEARVADGTLVQALASLLPQAASEGAPSAAAEAALSAPDPVVVASWGGELQVLLQGAPQLPVSKNSPRLRVVLVQGGQALLDQEHEVEQSDDGLRLRLPLPHSGGYALHAAAMSLYIFALNVEDERNGSLETVGNVVRSSSSVKDNGLIGSNDENGGSAGSRGSSSTQGSAPLAHLTVLLFPPAAAAELMFWVEQQQLSPELLQPLLEDMAVAIEGATAAAGGGAGAVGLVGNAAVVLSQAAEECQQARAFAESCALVECADLMAVCLPRILLMLHQVQPLAAGGVQLPAGAGARGAVVDQQFSLRPSIGEGPLGAAVMAAGAGLAAEQTSKALLSPGQPVVSALGAAERMATPAVEAGPSVSPVKSVEKGMCRDGQGVGSKQCAPAGQANSSSAVVGSESAAAGGGCQGWVFLWWCAAGAFMGWSDQQLEAAYQASRLQQRPPTWIMMGCMDLITNVLMGGRGLLHAFRVGSAWNGAWAWAWGVWHISGEIFGIMFALWILFSPKQKWRFMGLAATLHSFTASSLFWLVNIFARHSENKSIMVASFGKQPSFFYSLTLFGAVRIVLLQLSPPWLLQHATVPAVTFGIIFYSDPSFCSVMEGIPVWLQIAAVCAAAVGVVVVQEAFSRAKYIRAVASSTRSPIRSATGGPHKKTGKGSEG
jgi:hypothetical protein